MWYRFFGYDKIVSIVPKHDLLLHGEKKIIEKNHNLVELLRPR